MYIIAVFIGILTSFVDDDFVRVINLHTSWMLNVIIQNEIRPDVLYCFTVS